MFPGKSLIKRRSFLRHKPVNKKVMTGLDRPVITFFHKESYFPRTFFKFAMHLSFCSMVPIEILT